MKILLLGKDGQIGWELQRSLAPLGELVALGRQGQGDWCGDLSQPAGLAETVRQVKPDVIVNAAGFTAVDRAESEPALAAAINTQGPVALASAAQAAGAWLVHYSTDYVFDGQGHRPWRETDPGAPLNVYGRTKLDGEREVMAHCTRHLIFRTSWVYAARGGNFARTMLRLAGQQDRLRVVDDQVGAPTGAELVADVTAHALRSALATPAKAGLYHLAASGETSWHGYARFVVGQALAAGHPLKVPLDAIDPITSASLTSPARRPLNSRLDTRKLQDAFDLKLPAWQTGVARLLDEIL